MVTNDRLQKIQRILPEVDLESSRSPAKLSVGVNPFNSAVQCFPHDNIVGSRLCDEFVKSNEPSVFFTSSCPLCDCSSKFVYRPKNVYQLVQNTSIWRHVVGIFDTSPTDSSSSCSVLFFFRQVPNILQRTFPHVHPCGRIMRQFLREVSSHPGSFSIAVARIRDSNIFLHLSITMRSVCIHVEHIPSIRDPAMMLFRQN